MCILHFKMSRKFLQNVVVLIRLPVYISTEHFGGENWLTLIFKLDFLENFDENGNKTQHMSVSCTSSQVLFYRIVTCLPSTFRDKWCLRHHCFRQRKVPNICQRKSNWSGGLVWTVRVVSDFQRPLLSSLSIIITLGTFFNFDFMNVLYNLLSLD